MAGLGPTTPNVASGPLAPSPATLASALLIEELGAASGKAPRTCTLTGPNLPFRGAEWGGKNVLVTQWNPGNGDEATQQNLGPQEVPSHWQGEWSRVLMGKQPVTATDENGTQLTIVDPDGLANFLESIFRAGQRLRVTWSNSSGNEAVVASIKKVREGRAGAWGFKYGYGPDLQWSVNFEWQSRGARSQTVTSTRDGSLQAGAAALNVAMSNLTSLTGALGNALGNLSSLGNSLANASHLTLGQLEALANAPTTFVQGLQRSVLQVQSQLQQLANIALTLESQPLQVVATAQNIAKNIVAQLNQFEDTQGQLSAELMTVGSNPSLAQVLQGHTYFGQVLQQSQVAAQAAQDFIARMRAKVPLPPGIGYQPVQSAYASQGDLIAVWVTKDGDTPQKISQKFYGTPDHALDILQANKLPWMQASFPKGKVLLIPRLRSAQSGA